MGGAVNTLLGALIEVRYEDAGGKERRVRWPLKRAPALIYDAKGRLVIVYSAHPIGVATKAAAKEYARTHWGERGKGLVLEGTRAKAPLRKLGPLVCVIYTTKKGRAKLTDYRHDFEKVKPSLFEHRCGQRSCKAKGTLTLRGGSYRMRTDGITG